MKRAGLKPTLVPYFRQYCGWCTLHEPFNLHNQCYLIFGGIGESRTSKLKKGCLRYNLGSRVWYLFVFISEILLIAQEVLVERRMLRIYNYQINAYCITTEFFYIWSNNCDTARRAVSSE